MNKLIYTVHAYRWGDRECHSYLVGVYTKKLKALEAAEAEEEYRGGKYECEVREWKVDNSFDDDGPGMPSQVIKALPKADILTRLGNKNKDE